MQILVLLLGSQKILEPVKLFALVVIAIAKKIDTVTCYF